MAVSDNFDKNFDVSYNIIDSYDILAALLYSKDRNMYDKDIKLVLDNLKKLLIKEVNNYNKMDMEDIICYTEEFKNIPVSWYDLADFRIHYRIGCVYDRLIDNTINLNELYPELNIDYELGIRDIINSKIEIDVYRLISSKLNNLYLTDNVSKDFQNKLLNLNNQYIVIKLSMRELSEILLLKSDFDIDKMLNIDLSFVEDKISTNKGNNIKIIDIVKDKAYNDIISLIDKLKIMTLDSGDVNNIYNNLFSISYIEVLLDYLDINKLIDLCVYCSSINIRNSMLNNNLKCIIKKKLNMYK